VHQFASSCSITVLLCPTLIYFKFNSISQLQVLFLNSFLIVLFEYMRQSREWQQYSH
jgi:hypothetical protein